MSTPEQQLITYEWDDGSEEQALGDLIERLTALRDVLAAVYECELHHTHDEALRLANATAVKRMEVPAPKGGKE